MAERHRSGKLVVILHADIAGSTALVQQDERLAHERIQETFHRFGDIITQYHGRVRELRGDALLAEFEGASDAVTSALALQADQSKYNAQFNDNIQPTVRVGIAMGEVIIADNTVTGAGVVLAQRVEQMAEPGGVVIQGAAYETIPGRFPFAYTDLGEHEVKGFDKPVRAYSASLKSDTAIPEPEQADHRVRNTLVALVSVAIVAAGVVLLWFKPWEYGEEPTSIASMEFALPDKPSIAVLPFINMSGDPEQEYFADGITEDLTTDLSRLSGLFVIARNSAFSYKGRSVDLRTVAEELGVRYLLEGSVRRVGAKIRINAQLIDGENGGHLWAERFDGTMADVFDLQDHVNRKIVAELEVNLTAADEKRFDHVETTVADAYDLVLRGVERYNVFNRDAVVEARDLFEQAAALDPNYARAYANIALSYATEVNFFWSGNREESIRLGLEFADKALALDDSIPQIYLTRSILYLSQRQHQTALEAARRTIEVHPNYADGQVTLAFIQSYSGKLEPALESLARAKQFNPQGTGVYLAIEGRILFLLGRYEEALRVLEQSLDRNPAFDRVHLHAAAVNAELGRLDDAAWSVDEALAISPDISLTKERRESLYLRESDIDHYIEALTKAGVPE